MPLGIERVSAPVHSANVTGYGQSVLQSRRTKNAFVTQPGNHISAGFAVGRRNSPSVIRREALRGERGRRGGERLSGRSHLARHVTLRHGAFFDGKYRNASVAVQHVKESSFVALNYHRNLFAVMLHSSKQRRRSSVVIPEVVMNELASPCNFPGLRVQRHHGVRPFIISGPQTTVIVWASAAGRHEDKIAYRIDYHYRPGIPCPTTKRFRRGFHVRALRIGLNRIPTPAQLA